MRGIRAVRTTTAAGPAPGGGSSRSIQTAPADGRPREYCNKETFEARCATNEVIVVTHAIYGRPSVGRCVKPEYGFTGCSSDVRRQADVLCSGRHHCQITTSDPIFEGTEPCREDLKLHLELGYRCEKGKSNRTGRR